MKIHLYTSNNLFDPKNILADNEFFFNGFVRISEMDEFSIEAMREIDKAEILDIKNGTIRTPYGTTSIFNLSTGCKTVLNYSYIARHRDEYHNIKAMVGTEAGWNALEVLFKAIEHYKLDIGVILEHDDKTYLCSKREYVINNNIEMDSLSRFYVGM